MKQTLVENYRATHQLYNKPYAINNPLGHTILEGDRVIVHPTKSSKSTIPHEAIIVIEIINWVGGASYELCTWVPGGYKAVLNEYLFNRLELIK